MKEKRKSNEARLLEEEANKKKRKLNESSQLADKIEDLKVRSLVALQRQMEKEEISLWKGMYGNQWEEARNIERMRLEKSQREWKAKMVTEEEIARTIGEREFVSLKSPRVFLDDVDPRY